jgi:monoamine oxidase
MRADLRTLSKEPTADSHTPTDIALDRTSLREYLETRGAGRIAAQAIEQAYLAEYGREIAEQSCLNFLLFIHADRRSKFTPFGVFSDERYHLVDGNEGIVRGLAAGVSGQVAFGKRLVRARKTSAGRVELRFADGTSATHEAVVLTAPFSVLRGVDLTGLDLPPWKTQAIAELGYGDNAKTMVGFRSPYWRSANASGASYSDLANHQTTWETNPSRAGANGAVLTDYSGGLRGKLLDGVPLATAVGAFLGDLDRVLPGALVQANGLAFREHWPSNPLSLGSYTCYLPGQFTSIAGNEGKPAGNVFFAGEHADSFYSWQGFMEGALLSGLAAAKALTSKK